MSFRLGAVSEANLTGVAPGIVACVHLAIAFTIQDFGVFEGLRTIERQRALVLAGASRTLDSYHLPDKDGTGHAVDLVPYVLGRLQWQMPCCLLIAAAMHKASHSLGVPLTWGGVWDRQLGELDPRHLDSEVQRYRKRFLAAHPAVYTDGEWHQPEPLIDGPHFQGLRIKAAA